MLDIRQKINEGIKCVLSIQDILWRACSLHLLSTIIKSTPLCYPKLSQQSPAEGPSDPAGLKQAAQQPRSWFTSENSEVNEVRPLYYT